jgi:hypothetical protein
MRARARIGLAIVACLAIQTAALGDRAPVIPSVALKDGRVLHNVRIMSNEGSSIVVHADEGLLKIERTNLPTGIADNVPAPPPDRAETAAEAGMVMQSFNPNQAQPQDPQAAPVPIVTPPPKRPPAPAPVVPNPVFKGCSIVSFAPKAFNNVLGCAEVVIHNDTDVPVIILPHDILCIAVGGARHIGRLIVSDGFPPHIKRKEFVPPRGDVDDIVTFTDDEIDLSSVQWAH